MVLPFYQRRSLFNDIGSLVDWRATRNLHGNALQRIRCTTCLTNLLGRG